MLSDLCDRFRPLALTLLRLAVGVVFLYHGFTKVSDLGKSSGNFVHMGFPGWVAYLIGPLELIGGGLLVLGLLTRLFGLLLAGDMLVALVKVSLPRGSITQVGRYELVMLLAAAAFTLFAFGGGPVALDRVLFGRGRSRASRGRGAGAPR
jgi:putative oxidoreductase